MDKEIEISETRRRSERGEDEEEKQEHGRRSEEVVTEAKGPLLELTDTALSGEMD